MKITIAKSSGFCFGVKRAIDIALKTASSSKEVYMLGDIIHNEVVVKQIKEAGIKKIKRLYNGKDKLLLIRAHGTGKKTIHLALQRGYTVIDATCPKVKEIHKIVREMEEKGYQIIVIGDKNHDEVHGIIGQLKNKATVISDKAQIPLIKNIRRIKQACVVVQSTQNTDNVMTIVRKLEELIPKLEFFNTICKPTMMRQEEIKKLPLENDAIIVIGSRKSANTKRLFEISLSLNKHSYWINAKEEINPAWFKGVKRVGITSGASTPQETTQEIAEYIQTLK